MLAEDLLIRPIVPPRGFVDELLDPVTFLDIQRPHKKVDVWETSLGALCCLPNDNLVHAFGEAVANDLRARDEAKFGSLGVEYPIATYAGYYSLSYLGVIEPKWKFHTVSVFLQPEGNLDTHFALRIAWNRREGTRQERQDEREFIKRDISKLLTGPQFSPIYVDEQLRAMIPTLPREFPSGML